MSKNQFLFIFLCAGFFLYWKHSKQPEQIPLGKSPDYRELVTSTSCEGKRACVVVYVTPWCPACEQLSPLFQSWVTKAKDDKEYGIKMIVGLGQAAGDNERLAQRYGPDCVVDQGKKLHDILGVKYYPTMLMVEKDGVIAKRDDKVIQWAVDRYNIRP